MCLQQIHRGKSTVVLDELSTNPSTKDCKNMHSLTSHWCNIVLAFYFVMSFIRFCMVGSDLTLQQLT